MIVAGHAHTFFNQRIDDTFILEARSKGHGLNRLEMVVGPEGLDPDATIVHPPWGLVHKAVDPGCEGGEFPMTPLEVGGVMLTPSRDAIDLIKRLEKESGSLCEPVGCLKVPMKRIYDAESGLGDLMSDAMLSHFPKAHAAFTNAGGIRSDLVAGTIRREHIHAIMPFENRILLAEISGKDLRTFLEIGTSGGPGMIQLSGSRISFNPDSQHGRDLNEDGEVEAWERTRLCSAEIAGEPLRDSAMYQIVTTDFIFSGGDRYGAAFQNATILKKGPLLRDVLMKYVSSLKGCIDENGPMPRPDAPRIFHEKCHSFTF